MTAATAFAALELVFALIGGAICLSLLCIGATVIIEKLSK